MNKTDENYISYESMKSLIEPGMTADDLFYKILAKLGLDPSVYCLFIDAHNILHDTIQNLLKKYGCYVMRRDSPIKKSNVYGASNKLEID